MSYLIGIDVTTVSDIPVNTEGAVYTADTGEKYKYVKVRNESATVVGAAGDIVAYLKEPTSSESFTVVTDNTDAATKPVGAGVLQATIVGAANTAEWVWVQVQGAFTANQNLAGTPADGDALFLSTTDMVLTLATAADDPICAFAIDDSADLCMAAFAH